MSRLAIDPDGVSAARARVADDSAALRACAQEVAAAFAAAAVGLGGGCLGVTTAGGLGAALGHSRLVRAHAVDAVAAAVEALSGDLDLVADEARALEQQVSAAFAASGVGR
jgi:hypothetical protein